MLKNQILKCRVCGTNKSLQKFSFDHLAFLFKDKNWDSVYCFECDCISEYINNENDNNHIYSDGSYRSKKKHFNIPFKPPIDFWSVITIKRAEKIFDKLKNNSNFFLDHEKITMLDYGGYNGLLPYTFQKLHEKKVDGYVADFDKQGLKFANFIGIKTIDLNDTDILNYEYNLITIVHVLEHLENPTKLLKTLKEMHLTNCYIYLEVPNLYGKSHRDPAHKIEFSLKSILNLLNDIGIYVEDYGFIESPKETINFGSYYNNKIENIYIIANLSKSIVSKTLVQSVPLKDINEFKLKLYLSYAKIMINNIFVNLISKAWWFFKTSLKYFIYGITEILFIKIIKKTTDDLFKFFRKR